MTRFVRLLALGALIMISGTARATDLAPVDGFDIQWDTTLRETLAARIDNASAALLANINSDDGDRAFTPGLISVRTDLFTELTAERGDLGFDVSAQGWYDPVYQGHSANNSPSTFNPSRVPHTEFPGDVRQLMGDDAELLNAYAKDHFSIGAFPVSVRVGRQTLLWGESLFFPGNGIAAGQAPVDEIKALSEPLAQARELYLPVTQAVVRIELTPGVAVEAYDQFEWRRDRLPGVASYFSTTDILDVGGDRLLLPDNYSLYRSSDVVPHGSGQFGVALRIESAGADYGIYALRYDSKQPVPEFHATELHYDLVFPTGIDVLGASASTYLGTSNIAGEVSFRHNMPLVASRAGLPDVGDGGYAIAYAASYAAAAVVPAVPPPPNYNVTFPGGEAGGYATANTAHAQASIVSQLPPSHWWAAADLQAEIAANDLLDVTGGRNFVQPGRTHLAASAQLVFTPTYFQVVPGLDLNLPFGIEYTPIGRSSIDAGQNAGTGTISAGISLTYRTVWQVALSATHFIGGAGAQKLADRDFVALSATRSF